MPAILEDIAEQIRAGQIDKARATLQKAESTDETRSELTFLRGYLQELSYEREAALKTYQQLLQQDPDHTEAAFRAALLADQFGDDEAAIELYERCTAHPPVHVNAMLNLAVLYEEDQRLDEAESLVRAVLKENPNHRGAEQLLKSIESSFDMVLDDHAPRERDGRSALFDTPVSDFELSVRSRNCLKQMNIRTLGDLLRTTEAELLSYRNFGETSLNEIKQMLSQKSLRLGQAIQPVERPAPVQRMPHIPGDASVHLSRPISELELSVRSRKCLQRLGVATLGELVLRSEPELLAIKNFGQTSLNEIKQQLTNFGLSLRTTT
jgi:DNA-directed RNA polymerase subunit alpha